MMYVGSQKGYHNLAIAILDRALRDVIELKRKGNFTPTQQEGFEKFAYSAYFELLCNLASLDIEETRLIILKEIDYEY